MYSEDCGAESVRLCRAWKGVGRAPTIPRLVGHAITCGNAGSRGPDYGQDSTVKASVEAADSGRPISVSPATSDIPPDGLVDAEA